jgi:hypothetical protein
MDHKQHLRVKTFYGTSDNAVKVQVWVAMTDGISVACHIERALPVRKKSLSIITLFGGQSI